MCRGSERPLAATIGERFTCPEEAWFWTCGVVSARRHGHQRHGALVRRNCDPDDVLLCVERLLRIGRLTEIHARVLGTWGLLGSRPSQRGREAKAARLWSEAMAIVAPALIEKDIVSPTPHRTIFLDQRASSP
jgi:hypothetical protein